MTKEFVPYQPSLDMKSIGFDEECFTFWTNTPKYKGDNIQLCITDGMHGYSPNSISFKQDFLREGECLAPLYQQAFRWFREKYEIDGLLHKRVEGSYYFWITECDYNHYKYYNQMVYFNTYEEAEQACLIKLIEIVKDGKSKSNS
jgi:hypothetical protein